MIETNEMTEETQVPEGPKKPDPLALLDEQGEYPSAWIPEVGDCIAGVVRRYSQAELKKVGLSWLCTVQTDDTTVQTIFLTNSVLKSEFARLKPKIGERISIRYLGIPANKEYHKYVVRCPGREDDLVPDWDDLGGGTPYADQTVRQPQQAQRREDPRPVNRGPAQQVMGDPFADE